MADQSSTTTIDPYELLKIIHNPDDTLTRNFPISDTPSSDDPNFKDILLNPQHKTWIRIFRPTTTQLQDDDFSVTKKLPLIIYFHGGGFIICSASSTIFHDLCKSMATHLSVLVLSVDYRLAPENRLPAAYDDATDALNWVRDQALDAANGEKWLRDYADFSNCFIMGCSAGGNIAYHAGLRALELDLEPVLKISGLILNQPFFGGVERTGSELRLVNDKVIPIVMTDMMWGLALPIGADRDHFYSNPMVEIDGGGTINGGKLGLMIRRCLLIGGTGDPLIDRQIEFGKMLEGKGVKVVRWIDEEGFHGIVTFEPKKAEEMLGVVKDFIFSNENEYNVTGGALK
ncbi:Alpha/beta hydrolase fold-3 [Macleaya cordata]|uniref:Alpha/beta hydrolase fold-3 n=1 Tax=Macleaya cordata TaxID=56857 RepID=A0A200PMP2_MACCD|nr:Alpha/beta hydrolase fold-3 [Macleaya cordata]